MGRFFYNLGQAGGTDVLKDSFNAITDAINEVNAMLSSGEMQSYLGAIGVSFGGLAQDAANGLDAIEQMIQQWSNNSQSR